MAASSSLNPGQSLTDQLHESNSLTGSQLAVFKSWEGRVCKISLDSNSNDGGTGILIASGVILTCSHVLPTKTAARKYQVQFEGTEKACGLAPEVLFLNSPSPGEKNPTKKSLDYTVIALDTKNLPLEILEICHTAESIFKEGVVGSAPPKLPNVSLVHYPSQVAMQKKLIMGIGSITDKTTYNIMHTIATEKGSSGALLLDASGRLLGMHRYQRSAVSIEQILASLGPDGKEKIEKVSNDFLERILTEKLSETVCKHYQRIHSSSSIFKVNDRKGAWEIPLPIVNVYTGLVMLSSTNPFLEKSEKEEEFDDRRIETYESLESRLMVKRPIGVSEIFNSEIGCFGCLMNVHCFPMGYRTEKKYCSTEGFILQVGDEESCNNSFECLTNLCIDGMCIEEGLFKKFLAWFRTNG